MGTAVTHALVVELHNNSKLTCKLRPQYHVTGRDGDEMVKSDWFRVLSSFLSFLFFLLLCSAFSLTPK